MAEPKPKVKGLLGWTGEAADSIYVLIGLLISAGLNGLFQIMVTSATMRSYMTVPAVAGSLFGYGLTVLLFKGAGKRWRSKVAAVCMVIFLLLAGFGLFTLWVIGPTAAQDHPWLVPLRDQLVAPSDWANAIMALVSGLGSFFFMSAFAVMSPALERASHKD